MARNCECRVLVDTSIVWHIAFNTVLAGIVRSVMSVLARHCEVIYTEFNLEEILVNEKLNASMKRKLIEAYRSLGRLIRANVEKERVWGRYGRWVKTLGRYDVLHAITAARLDAILVTGDWRQAKFARDTLRASVLYIPVSTLARVCRGG